MIQIHPDYKAAEWRCTTNTDTETDDIGISFSLANGKIIRLRLNLRSAKRLAQTITKTLDENTL